MTYQLRYRSWLVYCVLVLTIILSIDRIQAQDQQNRLLEPGKTIERELTGGQSHSYQISLAAGQYVRLVVDQRGIDVVVRLFGPDGELIAEFDSGPMLQGSDTASWVAEEVGAYRLDVMTRQKKAATGRYGIQVAELRGATESDRASFEADTLYREFIKLRQSGKYNEARTVGERMIALREKALGTDHPDTAQALNSLGILYNIMDNDAQAEQLFQRALAIWEKTLGPEHPALAKALNNLAGIYRTRSDYARAEALLKRALTIDVKVLGSEHPDVAQDYNNLAVIYDDRGDSTKAEPLYKRALAIWEKTLGPEHPALAQALNNLAGIYKTRSDYAQAEELFQRALSIFEKAAGPEHPIVVKALLNLAGVCKERGDYAQAEALCLRALTISKKALGPNHPEVARGLFNLAVIYRKRGDYAQAAPLYERALANVEMALGADHTDMAEILNELAMLHTAKDDIGEAIVALSRANAIDERNFTLILAGGSERQKLAFLDLYSKWTNLTLSLQSEFAPNDPQALNLAFTTVLRRKARGLDAMADTLATIRRHATPQDREDFDKLKDARSQLAALKLADPGAVRPDTYQRRVKDLEDAIDDLEAKLSSRSGNYRKQSQPATLSAIQAALPVSSALIEFAYFTPLNPKTEKTEPPRYLAYLLAPQGQPRWIDLGKAAPIDQAIDDWRKALRDPVRTDVKRLARALDKLVMQPVRAILGDMPGNPSNLLIAPDGALNLIPFAALVDEKTRYLIERYAITYLTSGRDLLRLQTSEPSKGAPIIVANPDFGSFATVAMRGARNSRKSPGSAKTQLQKDPTKFYFQPLPSTEDEALAIRALLPKASLLAREDATETALKQAIGPQILHIATHGFFLDYQAPAPVEDDPSRISAPATTGLSSGRAAPYTIQIEAAPALETAQERVNGLKAQGIDAYIVRSEVKRKGTFYRVRVGNFRTQAEAWNHGVGLREKRITTDFFVARYEPPQGDLIAQLSNTRLSKFATQIKDPLLRSGLALAGANHGKSGDDDGVLTALEAAYLDLSGTQLVVLSACDTGVGEVKNGEGVQGLRRALVLAGSESQVMSLWPISDEATKDLMIPYYKALQEGKGRSEGLRKVQLRMLRGRKDRQHPFYWAAFIQSGEWANLDSQR
jgi:CHAT domain-containing protein/Flp pilus assembly protein TadD